MEAKNEQNQVQVEGAHEAANAADTKHPHHYDPAKQDIKTEEELRFGAADNPRSNGSPGSQAATRVDVETTHFRGEDLVRAEPPEEFTGIKFSSVKDYAGGVPAVL